jgi:hypothetical protein
MPNSQNKSNGKSGIVQPKRRGTKAAEPNAGQEQAGKKQTEASRGSQGGSGRSSGQGRRSASGGNPND